MTIGVLIFISPIWLGFLVGEKDKLTFIITHVQDGNIWFLPSSLQTISGLDNLQNFVPIELPNIRNWTLDCSAILSQRVASAFFINSHFASKWGGLIWVNSISPTKTLVLQKLLHNRILSYKDVQFKGFTMCTLCKQQEESTLHFFSATLFLKYCLGSNKLLQIWLFFIS